MRLLRLSALCLLSLAAVSPGAAAPAAPAPPPPNVILILADDLALGDLAAFNGGKTRTPAIDRLVAEGVWFNAAYSASAVCSPARAALLTGRYPHRTGVVSLDLNREPELTRLHRDERTLGDMLAAHGYVTGLIGKWHIGSGDAYHPLRRGFAEFEGFFGSDQATYDRYPFDVQGVKREVTDKYLTENLSERAVAFVRRHRDRPFFLHLAHYAPHRPLGAPAAVVAPYLAAGFDQNTATIYAMIEIMDRGLGELMAALQELGLRERTLVIFASDNGPDPIPGPRFNHQRRGTKYEVHEGGIRVPFLVAWPGVLRPRSTDLVAHFTDVVPTVLELCRLPRTAGLPFDGVSLAGHLLEREAGPRPVRFWQWNRGVPNYTHNAAMREGEWKLVRPSVTRNAIAGDSTLATVLYNLQLDPLETTDVSAQHPDRVARMDSALADWCRAVERDRGRASTR